MKVMVSEVVTRTETRDAEIIGRFFGPVDEYGITHISVVQPGVAPDRRWVLEPEKYDYLLVRVPKSK